MNKFLGKGTKLNIVSPTYENITDLFTEILIKFIQDIYCIS